MSAVRVHIAPLLHSYTGGKRTIESRGATLGEVLTDLERQYPGIRFRIVDEQDRARPHMRFFVNENDVRDLRAAVREGDEVHIIGALSGG